MAKQTQSQKAKISIAGEYGVASELSKRGYNASITYGNAKAVDIIITGVNKGAKVFKTVEVKTSCTTRIVTNFFQKYGNKSVEHPDYWIIVHIDKNMVSHYYVLTHDEMGAVQMSRNSMTSWAPVPGGCDNVLLSHIRSYEGQWDKIVL